MWGIEQQTSWHSLANPFMDDRPEVIAGHVSCRSTEIHDIIAGRQNALILAGRPNIGKSTLIRYLKLPPSVWSWRDELEEESDNRKPLNAIHFAQIDLKPLLVGFENEEDKLLHIFIKECTKALYQAYMPGETFSDLTLGGLYKLLNMISDAATEETRYFLILDNIERLGQLYMQLSNIKNETKKPQEYGITLLDRCRAIRTIIDLIDEFKLFGFILSIESLPKARVVDQFTYISADLARFTTKTLQIFTMSDTQKFLAQPIKDFRSGTNNSRNDNGFSDISPLFAKDEQSWVLELTGTQPYLLQQCCYYLFQFKAYSARGADIQDSDKEQLLSIIYEQISTFLSRTWKRLQEAINNSSNVERVEKQFQAFVALCATKKAEDTLDFPFWDSLDPELRYILYSEGIVRYDLFRPVHFPGTILRDYLVQQVKEKNKTSENQGTLASIEHVHWLHIAHPDMGTKHIPLSKLEYRLLKTLLKHADYCTEQELIQGAWERGTERSNFTQRLYKLRKKLEEQLDGIDIIENRYGGIYSLTHADWLELD
jgi:Transcriptional regulatory protein, C terminal